MDSNEILEAVYQSQGRAEHILLAIKDGRIDEAKDLAWAIFNHCSYVMRQTRYQPD